MQNYLKIIKTQFKFYCRLLSLMIRRIPNGNSMDRWILESKIIKEIVFSKDFIRIISVGISWTSKDYFKLFDIGTSKVFKTVDPFNASDDQANHFNNRFEQLSLEELYDVILLNGVIGYGTDSLEEVELIFEQCTNMLSLKGVVIIGAKAVNGRIQFPSFDIYETAYSYGFTPTQLPGYKCSYLPTSHQNGHSFWAFRFKQDHRTGT